MLNTIFNEARQRTNSKVLDVGFGTGVLTSKLYENGHQIDGIDFSSEMISVAKTKMPHVNLLEWDISNGLPPEISGNKYDSIISTYTLHHLEDQEKISFITNLLSLLKKNGEILIGDVSFDTRDELEKCRLNNIENWDDDEFYFVYDEINYALMNECQFYPISHCGGVFIIKK
nr:class I SAM-dependent methyltransferase [Salicibibacter kimchii]